MMNSGERNMLFNFPGYYGHGVPANYCYTNESSFVQNNKKEDAKKRRTKTEGHTLEMVNEETQVFVSVWKKNFAELQFYKAPGVWREISTKVSEVGYGKSVKQCKLKLRHMKASYHDAKLNNDKTGNEPNSLPFMRTLKAFLVVETQLKFPKWRRSIVKHRLK